MPATPAVTNTIKDIIKDAMVDAGLLGAGTDPDSDQLASNMRRLCDIINILQVDGLKLFVYEELDINLVADTQTYTIEAPTTASLPERHLRIISGRILNTDNISRPIYPVSWEDYLQLSPENSSGAIVNYFVNKQPSSLTVSFYSIPDATEAANTAKMLVQKQIENPTNLTDAMQFPLEWRIALRWALADDICTGQPAEIMRRCESKADYYRTKLEDFDVEDVPVQFTPSLSNAYPGGRFR